MPAIDFNNKQGGTYYIDMQGNFLGFTFTNGTVSGAQYIIYIKNNQGGSLSIAKALTPTDSIKTSYASNITVPSGGIAIITVTYSTNLAVYCLSCSTYS